LFPTLTIKTNFIGKNMKKSLLYGLALFAAASLSLSSCDKTPGENPPPVEQDLAPTAPQNRTVLLEDFTGITCGYCPDGHDRAKAYAEANAGKVVVIAVHAGGYAVPKPSSGYPDDFRSSFGQQLNDQAMVAGYPAGTVNRHVFDASFGPQKPGGMAMGRGSWAMAGDNIQTMSAPVNLGVKTTWDEGSRTLTIKTETYYTGEETVQNNLNIAILENGLTSTQSDYSLPQPYKHMNYIQNNVLRHLVTGQWGEKIETTTVGARNKKTYTYVVPANFNIDNLDVALFVTHNKVEVLNAIRVKAK
jgi:thiol-disulfide isomerase/thioredoxin